MTAVPMSDREIAELSCPRHEAEVIKDLPGSKAWLRCKHCYKVMTEPVDMDVLVLRGE